MDRCVKISDARARLFDLVDEVTGAEDGVVLIEHRDRTERAALVGERYLRNLQNTITELRRHGGRSFQLVGSVQLVAPAAEMDLALGETAARPEHPAQPEPVTATVAAGGGGGERWPN